MRALLAFDGGNLGAVLLDPAIANDHEPAERGHVRDPHVMLHG